MGYQPLNTQENRFEVERARHSNVRKVKELTTCGRIRLMGKSLNLRSDKGWRKERGGCILSVSLPEGWGEVDADTRRCKSSASKLGVIRSAAQEVFEVM